MRLVTPCDHAIIIKFVIRNIELQYEQFTASWEPTKVTNKPFIYIYIYGSVKKPPQFSGGFFSHFEREKGIYFEREDEKDRERK